MRDSVGEDQYTAWMAAMELEDYVTESREVTIAVPSETHLRWLNRRYIPQLQEAFSEELGVNVSVRLIVDSVEAPVAHAGNEVVASRRGGSNSIDIPGVDLNGGATLNGSGFDVQPAEVDLRRHGVEQPRLNSRYIFSEFVVGESNRYAHAAGPARAAPPRPGVQP
ncbi:MAG: hypothetical protein JJU11_09890, partial [Candidatus Sumerlaeia bacterium]|nr:hypothetical protein [Candidatus Sumerlaeia bacterium]